MQTRNMSENVNRVKVYIILFFRRYALLSDMTVGLWWHSYILNLYRRNINMIYRHYYTIWWLCWAHTGCLTILLFASFRKSQCEASFYTKPCYIHATDTIEHTWFFFFLIVFGYVYFTKRQIYSCYHISSRIQMLLTAKGCKAELKKQLWFLSEERRESRCGTEGITVWSLTDTMNSIKKTLHSWTRHFQPAQGRELKDVWGQLR